MEVDNFGLISLVPFVCGIFFLVWKDDIVFPLLGALFIGSIIASKFSPVFGFLNISGVFITNALTDNLNIFLLGIIMEALIFFSLLNRYGVINTLKKNIAGRKLTKNRLESIISASSFLIFIDRHLSTLLAGLFSKPFAEKKDLSRPKHAYFLNTVSSSISTLVPYTTLTPLIIMSIGATFTGLGIGYSPVKAFLKSLPYQYFNIFSLFIVFSSVLLNTDILLMKRARELSGQTKIITFNTGTSARKQPDFPTSLYGTAGALALVFGTLIAGFALHRHGYNRLTILNVESPHIIFLNALFTGIIFLILFSFATKLERYSGYNEWKTALPRTLFMTLLYIVLSFSVESMARKLGFSGSIMKFLFNRSVPYTFIPLITFAFSSLISLLSGSSIFTITTVMPIAIRLISMNMSDPLIIDNILFAAIGSVLSGATFGDINSPFSLNFILSAATVETAVSVHFKTQVCYSLISFANSLIFGYLLLVAGVKPYLSLSSGLLITAMIFFFSKEGLSIFRKKTR
jgi:Na+/H+ antiporter NhaC